MPAAVYSRERRARSAVATGARLVGPAALPGCDPQFAAATSHDGSTQST